MTDTDRRVLQAYLNRPLDDLMEELELFDPASRGPAGVWNKVAGPLRQCLCVEWDYCDKRQDAGQAAGRATGGGDSWPTAQGARCLLTAEVQRAQRKTGKSQRPHHAEVLTSYKRGVIASAAKQSQPFGEIASSLTLLAMTER